MPGVSKGGGSRAGAAGVQRPFGLLLLVLFLQEQEKNEENDGKINDYLSYVCLKDALLKVRPFIFTLPGCPGDNR